MTKEEVEAIKRHFDEAMAPVQAAMDRAVAAAKEAIAKAKAHDTRSRPQPGDCGPDPSGSRNARG